MRPPGALALALVLAVLGAWATGGTAVIAGEPARNGLALSIEDVAGARVLHREPVTAGAAFVLAYVHSSEHVVVRGTFRVESDTTLTVVETAFGGFGPGLPELARGADWRIEHGMIVHRPPPSPIPELRVRVAPITRHRLHTPGGRELDLSDLMGPGGAVLVRVR